MQTKLFSADTIFESDTLYIADRKQYDLYPSDSYEEIHWWWTILNSGNIPLRAVFVLRGLKNVTVDLGGAKLVLHGRIMPFAVYDCENVTFRNFSIDYDRPFYTEGVVMESEPGSLVMQIPESFAYRIEGHDFIAVGETWEHRLITGDMLFSCIDPTNGRRSGGIFLGLIGDEIHPRPNPPLPIHHRQNTQEIRAIGIVETAEFLPGQCTVMHVTFHRFSIVFYSGIRWCPKSTA